MYKAGIKPKNKKKYTDVEDTNLTEEDTDTTEARTDGSDEEGTEYQVNQRGNQTQVREHRGRRELISSSL